MLSAFQKGVQDYGLPNRIRSDLGGENVDLVGLFWISIIMIQGMLLQVHQLIMRELKGFGMM